MDMTITPTRLRGTVTAPPSKSAAHRAAICAALARGVSLVSPICQTDDMIATMQSAKALGATCSVKSELLKIEGIGVGKVPFNAVVDCNESGSTFRFFVPIAAALGVSALFLGRGKLPERPITPLTDAMAPHGVRACKSGGPGGIIKLKGRLGGGIFEIPGDISSQYITGLLFALPLLKQDSEIRLTTPLQSKSYVDLTLHALKQADIEVEVIDGGWRVPGNQRYRPGEYKVEADYSGAAFWLCAGAISEPVSVRGLMLDSLQGDRAVLEVLRRFGARVEESEDEITVSPDRLEAVDVDVSDIPDLAPALAVTAACAKGTSTLYGAARLRIKESDRLRTITDGLQRLGAQIEEHDDKLVITGREWLGGGVVDSYADHRIAMAMTLATARCKSQVTVLDAQCVAKSYPTFYEHFESLGGNCHVL